MAENGTLLLHGELGVLNVWLIPSGTLVYKVPMVAASKKGEVTVFGEKAFEKDDSWELSWLQGGAVQKELFVLFFQFVFMQSAVQGVSRLYKHMVVTAAYVLSPRPGGRGAGLEYNSSHVISLGLPIQPYTGSEDRLAMVGHQARGWKYNINVSGEFTSMRRCENSSGLSSHCRFVTVGFDAMVNLFIKLLCEKGYDFTAQQDRLFCYKIVMDYCYVALDFEKELEEIEGMDGPLHEVTLEDGTKLELGKECIIAPEVLFNPGLVGLDEDNIMSLFQLGFSQRLVDSCPLFLIGACASGLKGLGERIQREAEAINVRFIDNPIRFIPANIREDAMRFSDLRSSRVLTS
mmetsp:Transcript_5736/g.7517  ORF Transcript_5736/g.7517 Transcript_5736/m.7517 type:complete len:348 (-) Transcript_5736:403-1446(-)